MRLPSTCKVIVVDPKQNFSLGSTARWASSIISYPLKLSKQSHVIIMYKYSGDSDNSYAAMHLSIDSVPQKHTTALTGEYIV